MSKPNIELSPPITAIKSKGQKMIKHKRHYVFKLEKGLFKKAGFKYWNDQVELTGEPVPGIGINKKLCEIAIGDSKRKLLINNIETGKHLLLTNEKRAWELHGEKKIKKTRIYVLPIGCFKTVNVI